MPPSKMQKDLSQRDYRSQGYKTSAKGKAPTHSPPTKILPVRKDDPICGKWTMILRTIVRNMNHAGVCVVVTTTVLVICDSKQPPHHRESSVSNIQRLLDDHKLSKVAVKFVSGRLARGAYDLMGKELDRRVLQVPCMLGESIALKGAHNSGTLGGLLELKMPGKAEYLTVGLTCFHCVNPSEKGMDPQFLARVHVWRDEGIAPDDNLRTRLEVENPSPNAIKVKIASVRDEICGIEQNEEYARLCDLVSEGLQGQLGRRAEQTFLGITKNLSELKSFLREMEKFRANFGSVFAASGFRTTNDCKSSNLDWALVEIPSDRVGDNITPDGHHLREGPIPVNLDDIPLFIHGQRSGLSKGRKGILLSAHLKHEIKDGESVTRVTYEQSIFPHTGLHFSQGGDSGALVFTESHVVVGMLIGGVISNSGFESTCSYFTPIDVLVKDIKKITKATDVRLKMDRSGTS
ncbi:hypothetical protein N7489_001488 [Penicillium chrysogenum]|uniref:Peptidase S1 domain-containing protein n=1 Tax=Penicillium chrysogenum TaxID=5076 RepID=A0ABQ8WIW4_PENCH|nr:uncharacterized protein N7489_001488 [Penicillium chrysogenum]KAJ5251078.1 hypothetical protein N7489_001488 [Penicillium chrysogenum]KAJ5269979.1 hypothetical protein N7505_005737 [Penicillium chrysogenum]